ncbi:MAG: hypothetical protein ACREUW_04230 [Burkholderiales bacterium]
MQTMPGGVRIEQRNDALRIEVAAPRAPLGAVALLLFGLVAIGLVTLSTLAVLPAHVGDGAGLLAIVLFGAVALPVAGFGAVFAFIGVVALGTGRVVEASRGSLLVQNTFLGMPAGGVWLPPSDIEVTVRPAAKYQQFGAASARANVVVVPRFYRTVMLAEALDEDDAGRLRETLLEALEWTDTPAPGAPHGPQ